MQINNKGFFYSQFHFYLKIKVTEKIYFLNPHEARRPRARSNFRPLDRTNGLVWDPGAPEKNNG